MDAALIIGLVDRDWTDFESACRRLALGSPARVDDRIEIRCSPAESTDQYLAVVRCDDYDAKAPLLDFADPAGSGDLGRQWWPRMESAPMNNINLNGRHVPILCVPGTRGYHLHPSHSSEQHPRSSWRLPMSAIILHRLLHQWGPYLGRGV
jgi:hypothetical protein